MCCSASCKQTLERCLAGVVYCKHCCGCTIGNLKSIFRAGTVAPQSQLRIRRCGTNGNIFCISGQMYDRAGVGKAACCTGSKALEGAAIVGVLKLTGNLG